MISIKSGIAVSLKFIELFQRHKAHRHVAVKLEDVIFGTERIDVVFIKGALIDVIGSAYLALIACELLVKNSIQIKIGKQGYAAVNQENLFVSFGNLGGDEENNHTEQDHIGQ